MDIKKFVGRNIRMLRNANSMTQEELAYSSGLSVSHLGSIERGTCNTTIDTLYKLASHLHVSINTLLDSVPPSVRDCSARFGEFRKYEELLQELSPEDRQQVLNAIDAVFLLTKNKYMR